MAKNKKINYDFSVEQLANKVNYDLQKDSFKIRDELDSNIQKYYEDITKILENDSDEQLRYYKYDLHYRHNVASTPKYLKQLLNDISYYNRKFDVKNYLDSINSIESKNVVSSIDSIISNLKSKKKLNSQFNNSNENADLDSKIKLKKLHKEILESWKESINKGLYNWQKSQIKKAQNATIKRVKGYLKAMQEAKDSINESKEIGEMFEDIIMEQLREGLKSGSDLQDFMNNDEGFEDLQNSSQDIESSFESSLGNGLNKDSKMQQYSSHSTLDSNMQNFMPQKPHYSPLKNPSGGNGLGQGRQGFKKFKKNLINLQKFLKFLKSDSIKQLCDILGQLQDAENLATMSKTESLDYNTKMPTKYANDEFSGLHFSSEISNILPQELMLFNDNDFNVLFEMKYAESRLLSFEKMGEINAIQSTETPMPQPKKGPIVLCIDTSGSMASKIGGVSPEIVAKAITLFMVKRARSQGRSCFLINFSVDIDTIDLCAKRGIFGLLNFLSFSFDGGTDAIAALKFAFKKCSDFEYKNADILMISDFIFCNNDMDIIRNIINKKEKTTKCHALYVGIMKATNLKYSPFDSNFIYNPQTKNIESLVKNLKKLDSTKSAF